MVTYSTSRSSNPLRSLSLAASPLTLPLLSPCPCPFASSRLSQIPFTLLPHLVLPPSCFTASPHLAAFLYTSPTSSPATLQQQDNHRERERERVEQPSGEREWKSHFWFLPTATTFCLDRSLLCLPNLSLP